MSIAQKGVTVLAVFGSLAGSLSTPLTILFIILKLAHVISWSWLAVASPLLISLSFGLVIILVLLLMLIVAACIGAIE